MVSSCVGMDSITSHTYPSSFPITENILFVYPKTFARTLAMHRKRKSRRYTMCCCSECLFWHECQKEMLCICLHYFWNIFLKDVDLLLHYDVVWPFLIYRLFPFIFILTMPPFYGKSDHHPTGIWGFDVWRVVNDYCGQAVGKL
jgi:hypothetical protein